MTVSKLIDILLQVDDKNKLVGMIIDGEFKTLDPLIGVNEYADCIEFQHDITDIVRNAIKNTNKN